MTFFCRMEAHTCRLREINIGFWNPVKYILERNVTRDFLDEKYIVRCK
jgi:hypothetical protein